MKAQACGNVRDPYDIVSAIGCSWTEPLSINTTAQLAHFALSSLSILIKMNRILQVPFSALLLLSCALNASAHGNTEHAQVEVAPDADWATRHMAGTSLSMISTQ